MTSTHSRWYFVSHLAIIIVAGEVIFSLPFHIARFFRPSFLNTFELSNTQLGDIFATYGVVAMLCYLPSGLLADRFAPAKLMSFSLIATALGGFYLLTQPTYEQLQGLFAYWGMTTILFFWSAMLKATRLLASHHQQGVAFGWLEGGRGFVASLLASIILLFPVSQTVIANFEDVIDMQQIIYFYSWTTLFVGLVVWFSFNTGKTDASLDTPSLNSTANKAVVLSFERLRSTLKNKTLWFQGGVVICAYCGYKSLDNYGIYVAQYLQYSETEAAQFTTIGSYFRPLAAIVAGFLADKLKASRVTFWLFLCLIICFISSYFLTAFGVKSLYVSATLLLTFVAVFALRGVYFALVEESQIKKTMTGTAVGVISFIGFTPDIFFASITGRILDSGDPSLGFERYFLMMTLVMIFGCLVAWRLSRTIETARAIATTQVIETGRRVNNR